MKKILLGLLIMSYWSFGQQIANNTPANYQNKVGIRARAANNKIMLRWGALSPSLWKTGNQNGYTITRKTLNASGGVVATTAFVVNKKPIADWQIKKDSSFYDIIYDAVYNNGFELPATDLTNTKLKLDTLRDKLSSLEREINTYRQSKNDSSKAALVFYSIGSTINSNTLALYQASVQNNYNIAYNRLTYFKTFFENLNPKPTKADSTIIRNQINNFYLRLISINDGASSVGRQYTDDDLQYGLSMMAADMKYSAAKMAGLGFVDESVVSGQKYRYTIKVNGTGTNLRTTAGPNDPIVVGIDSLEINANFTALPAPAKPNLAFKDGKIEIKWDFKNSKEYYGSYYLERKESTSSSYTRLTIEPFTKFDSSSDSLYYVDNMPNIKKTFVYRVVGISYFDELVNSMENSVESKKFYNSTPLIKGYKSTSSTTYKLNWKFLKNPLVDTTTIFPLDSLNYYKIVVSRQSDSLFTTLKNNVSKNLTNIDLLKTEIRTTVDTTKSYYIKIIAVTIDNDELPSLPFIVIPKDKTPPAKPTNLKAEAATNATTLDAIKTDLNTLERAINTYRVSKGDSNKTTLDFSPNTTSDLYLKAIRKNFYITYKRLGYFKAYFDALTPRPSDAVSIQGQIDKYNTSLSVISNSINSFDNYLVKVSWNANTEPDLLGYQVFRTIGEEREKIEVSGGIRKPIFITDTLSKKMGYPSMKYYVVAFDSLYNHSDTATVIFNKPDTRVPIAPKIVGYTVEGVDVTLQFQLSPDTDIDKYYVWRKEAGVVGSETQISLFTPADKKVVHKDLGLTNGKTYIYWIFAKDLSGNESCYDPNSTPKECIQLVPVKVISTKRSPLTVFTGSLDLEAFNVKLDWNYVVSNEVESFELYRGLDPMSSTSTEVTKFTLWKSLPPLIDRVENSVTIYKQAYSTDDFDVKDNFKYTYGIRVAYKDGTMSPMTTLTIATPDRNACTSGKLQIVKNTIIAPSATPIVDRACYEVILDEGFETDINGDYTAEIGNN